MGAEPTTEYHAVLSAMPEICRWDRSAGWPMTLSGALRHGRFEIRLGQLGLFADGAAPQTARVVFLAERHQRVPEIQQGFGEQRVFVQRSEERRVGKEC